MKVCLVYDPKDNKLRFDAYSFIYRGMLDSILNTELFEVQSITESCSAWDIEADVIIFYDVNSKHAIEIDGVDKHSALKIEYMSDPHQKEQRGFHKQYNMKVHKLSGEQRLLRAFDRGVTKIICPVRDGFYKYYEPILGDKVDDLLWWHPLAPWFDPIEPSMTRSGSILANGATWDGGIGCYDFRRYLFSKYDSQISFVTHFVQNAATPSGKDYPELLKGYMAGLALSDFYPVNKYFEMPMAGMVTFVQAHPEYSELGFNHWESCIYLNRYNVKEQFALYNEILLTDPEVLLNIAKRGQEIVQRFSAKNFVSWLYLKISKEIKYGNIQSR